MTPRVMSEAEKARQEVLSYAVTVQHPRLHERALDRAILLARLEQAETSVRLDMFKQAMLKNERDCLRAEVEKHGK